MRTALVPAIGMALAAIAAGGPPLTSIHEILTLPPAQLQAGAAVRLRAVVTEYSVMRWRSIEYPALFVADHSGGISVALGEQRPRLRPGDEVELEGRTGLGELSPLVRDPVIRVVGQAPLPAPLATTYADLANGRRTARRVEVQGIVRQIWSEDNWTSMDLSLDGQVVEVLQRDRSRDSVELDVQSLLGARVRVVGVVESERPEGRLRILVTGTGHEHIAVAGAFPRRPLPVPSATVAQVRADPARFEPNRVRLTGVVTYVRNRGFAIRDGTGSMLAYLNRDTQLLTPGDEVDAIGFADRGTSGTELTYTQIQKLHGGIPPAPIRISAREIVAAGVSAELVSLSARLKAAAGAGERIDLTFNDDGVLFSAVLEHSLPYQAGMFAAGSTWQVTGLALLQTRPGHDAPALRIRPRSDADLRLLKSPPWWSAPRVRLGLSIFTGLVLAWLSWSVALKRKVRNQAERLRIQFQKEMAMEERYRGIVENGSDIVFACGLDGRMITLNAVGERIVGLSREEVAGTSLFGVVAPEIHPIIRNWLNFARLHGGTLPNSEVDLLGRDGVRTTIDVRSRVVSRPGEPPHIEGIGRDVSVQKAAAAQLGQAKEAAEAASRAKSDFLANMSHEIRTPMNGVLGLTELALATELSEIQREYIDGVRQSANLLVSVINDVLDFSKIEAGKLELEEVPYDLPGSLRQAMQPLKAAAQQKGLEFSFVLGQCVPSWILGDRTRLLQVVNNLVNNATKFTERGSIAVELRREQPPRDSDDVRFKMLLSVRDTGIGIPAEKLDTVFESFAQADSSTTRRYGGTGLGLSIAASLVEMMGGRLWAESEPGRGSTFHFTFEVRVAGPPDEPCAPVRSVNVPAAARPPGALGRVLLAEDNRMNQMVATRMLEQRGWSVLVVSNGREAVEQWAAGGFAAVFMDVQMPEMDGLEATRAIRAGERNTNGGHARTPIVAMTAHAMQGDRERCLEAGMDAYLAKPIHADALERVLETLGMAPSNG